MIFLTKFCGWDALARCIEAEILCLLKEKISTMILYFGENLIVTLPYILSKLIIINVIETSHLEHIAISQFSTMYDKVL